MIFVSSSQNSAFYIHSGLQVKSASASSSRPRSMSRSSFNVHDGQYMQLCKAVCCVMAGYYAEMRMTMLRFCRVTLFAVISPRHVSIEHPDHLCRHSIASEVRVSASLPSNTVEPQCTSRLACHARLKRRSHSPSHYGKIPKKFSYCLRLPTRLTLPFDDGL